MQWNSFLKSYKQQCHVSVKWTPPWTFSFELSESKNNFLNFVSKLAKIIFHICVALKRTVFCLHCVLFLIGEWQLQRNVLLGMFLLLFTFRAFSYSSFFFVRNIFISHVVPFFANWTKRHEKSFVFYRIIFEEWLPAFAIEWEAMCNFYSTFNSFCLLLLLLSLFQVGAK